MSNIYLSQFPCNTEFLQGLQKLCPEIDSFSFYNFLALRQVTSNLENSMESYFTNYGISTGRFMLLLLLTTSPEGMMPSELAQQCCVTQATISGLLNSLEKAGLTLRETHISDRRACMIVITENGKELVEKIRPEFFNCLNQLMNQFTDDEEQKMVNWLGRLNESLHLINELKSERKLKIMKNI